MVKKKYILFIFLSWVLALTWLSAQNTLGKEPPSEPKENIELIKKEIDLEIKGVRNLIDERSNEQTRQINEAKLETEKLSRDFNWLLNVFGIGATISIIVLGVFLYKLFQKLEELKKEAIQYAEKAVKEAVDTKTEDRIIQMLESGELGKLIEGKEEALLAAIDLHALEQKVLEDFQIHCISTTKEDEEDLKQVLERYEIPARFHFLTENEEGKLKKQLQGFLKTVPAKKDRIVLLNNRGIQGFGNPKDEEALLYHVIDALPNSLPLMILGFGIVNAAKVGQEKWARTSFANMDSQIKGNLLRLMMMKE